MSNRYRTVGIEHRGYAVALVEERATGEMLRVYKRLGKWRLYRDDTTVKDSALRSCARRAFRQPKEHHEQPTLGI